MPNSKEVIMTNCIHENMTNSNEEIMKKTTIDFSCISAITFYQYLVVGKSDDTAQAVLTIQENCPVEFSPTPLGADAEIEGDDFGDYLQDLRINVPELYADIAYAIASEMIDIADIKFVKFNFFQIPICKSKKYSKDDDDYVVYPSRGSINDNYGDLLDDRQHECMFSLTSLY